MPELPEVEVTRRGLLPHISGRVISGVEVRDGTAEALPLADASVDSVTVAQAFHWFDAEAALREIERVMRADGLLALVSNRREPSAFDDVLARHRAHPPLEPPPEAAPTGVHRLAVVGFQPVLL